MKTEKLKKNWKIKKKNFHKTKTEKNEWKKN